MISKSGDEVQHWRNSVLTEGLFGGALLFPRQFLQMHANRGFRTPYPNNDSVSCL